MEVDGLPQIDPNLDYNTILPIHQKRTIAFVNHFLMMTVEFLNNFAEVCETKLMQFEYKMQKIEASLLILETQLASIPDLDTKKEQLDTVDLPDIAVDEKEKDEKQTDENSNNEEPKEEIEENHNQSVAQDPKYAKFFKMLQVGVPLQAVKQKMTAEGFDPNILD